MRKYTLKLLSYYNRKVYPRINQVSGTTKIIQLLEKISLGGIVHKQNGIFKVKINNIEFLLSTKESVEVIYKEPEFINYIKNCDFEHFIDIGAYKGFYSILAAKASEDARITSFEMSDENAEILKNNIELNKLTNRIKLEKKAVWNENSRIGAKTDKKGRSEINSAKEQRVKTVSLNTYIKRRKVDLIKIDVEGAEYRVIKGADEIIKKNKPRILLELHKNERIENFNHSPNDVIEMIEGLGYESKILNKGINDDLMLFEPN